MINQDTANGSMTLLYSLKQDVDNPVYDRRCKYGFEGIKTFKAGYKFAYDPTKPTYDDGVPRTAKTLSGKFIPLDVFRVLMPLAEMVHPNTFVEYKAITRASGLQIETDILEVLWEQPALAKLINEALDTVMTRLEAE